MVGGKEGRGRETGRGGREGGKLRYFIVNVTSVLLYVNPDECCEIFKLFDNVSLKFCTNSFLPTSWQHVIFSAMRKALLTHIDIVTEYMCASFGCQTS